MTKDEELQQSETQREDIIINANIDKALNKPIINSNHIVLSEKHYAIKFPSGLSGSLTTLTNGQSYLVAGSNIEIISSSNGSVTIDYQTTHGNNGDVFLNIDGHLDVSTGFTYNTSNKSLTVENLSGSLTKLNDGTSYLQNSGLVNISTGTLGNVTISRAISDDISAQNWQTYNPQILSSDPSGSPTLSSDAIIRGKYIYSNGIMKLIFSLSSRSITNATGGTGTYLITLPNGYELDGNLIPFGTINTPLDGICLASANISLDATGGGGTWAVTPISSTRLILVGKEPQDEQIYLWGSNKLPLGSSTDYRVSFVATFPAIQNDDVNGQLSWAGAQFVEGVLSFEGDIEITLSNQIYQTPNQYVLFDYSLGQFPPTGQNTSTQLSRITLNLDEIETAFFLDETGIINDTENKRILFTLNERILIEPLYDFFSNGCQYVEGNLNFAGSTEITLSKDVYFVPGTYTLFSIAGTVTGIQNLSVIHETKGTKQAFYSQQENKIKVTI